MSSSNVSMDSDNCLWLPVVSSFKDGPIRYKRVHKDSAFGKFIENVGAQNVSLGTYSSSRFPTQQGCTRFTLRLQNGVVKKAQVDFSPPKQQ